jgi:hypothetical protein
VDVESLIEIRGVKPAATGIDVDIAGGLKIIGRMGVAPKETDRKMIRNPIIDPDQKAARGKMVTRGENAVVTD